MPPRWHRCATRSPLTPSVAKNSIAAITATNGRIGIVSGSGKKEIQETPLPPHQLQVAPKHPQHQHVDQQMPQTAMQEDVTEGLPYAQAGNHTKGHQAEIMIDPCCGGRSEENFCQSLCQENARAGQYQDLDGWRNEPSPIEPDTRCTESRPHVKSVRR